jgi:hypothetical protein
MSLDDHVMAYLCIPGGQRNIKPTNLGIWKLFKTAQIIELHPLATLRRDVYPNPSALTFAPEVHPTDNEVISADIGRFLKTHDSPFQMLQIEKFGMLRKNGFQGFEYVPWLGLNPEP